ncbi:hypothetical protein JKP88DRAFT_350138 [Tribonema minus]|uniref:Uncharacterized protein n=1 Tax=Tribonema minus TaxID=303371 RepID=A0A836CC96_9STRA|nr:hypothetical protein JKP88DRAFT_350138 [Tribonema minus]
MRTGRRKRPAESADGELYLDDLGEVDGEAIRLVYEPLEDDDGYSFALLHKDARVPLPLAERVGEGFASALEQALNGKLEALLKHVRLRKRQLTTAQPALSSDTEPEPQKTAAAKAAAAAAAALEAAAPAGARAEQRRGSTGSSKSGAAARAPAAAPLLAAEGARPKAHLKALALLQSRAPAAAGVRRSVARPLPAEWQTFEEETAAVHAKNLKRKEPPPPPPQRAASAAADATSPLRSPSARRRRSCGPAQVAGAEAAAAAVAKEEEEEATTLRAVPPSPPLAVLVEEKRLGGKKLRAVQRHYHQHHQQQQQQDELVVRQAVAAVEETAAAAAQMAAGAAEQHYLSVFVHEFLQLVPIMDEAPLRAALVRTSSPKSPTSFDHGAAAAAAASFDDAAAWCAVAVGAALQGADDAHVRAYARRSAAAAAAAAHGGGGAQDTDAALLGRVRLQLLRSCVADCLGDAAGFAAETAAAGALWDRLAARARMGSQTVSAGDTAAAVRYLLRASQLRADSPSAWAAAVADAAGAAAAHVPPEEWDDARVDALLPPLPAALRALPAALLQPLQRRDARAFVVALQEALAASACSQLRGAAAPPGGDVLVHCVEAVQLALSLLTAAPQAAQCGVLLRTALSGWLGFFKLLVGDEDGALSALRAAVVDFEGLPGAARWPPAAHQLEVTALLLLRRGRAQEYRRLRAVHAAFARGRAPLPPAERCEPRRDACAHPLCRHVLLRAGALPAAAAGFGDHAEPRQLPSPPPQLQQPFLQQLLQMPFPMQSSADAQDGAGYDMDAAAVPWPQHQFHFGGDCSSGGGSSDALQQLLAPGALPPPPHAPLQRDAAAEYAYGARRCSLPAVPFGHAASSCGGIDADGCLSGEWRHSSSHYPGEQLGGTVRRASFEPIGSMDLCGSIEHLGAMERRSSFEPSSNVERCGSIGRCNSIEHLGNAGHRGGSEHPSSIQHRGSIERRGSAEHFASSARRTSATSSSSDMPQALLPPPPPLAGSGADDDFAFLAATADIFMGGEGPLDALDVTDAAFEPPSGDAMPLALDPQLFPYLDWG